MRRRNQLTIQTSAIRLLIVTLMLVALTSCAQPPTQRRSVSHYQTNFSSRMDLNVHYEANLEEAFASVYMGNPKGTQVILWLVLNHTVPGERVNRETLIYEGNDKTLHKIYRLPMGEPNTEGTLYVRVLSTDGRELIRSATVHISSKGETK